MESPKYLVRNSGAADFEQAGLNASLAGDQTTAHQAYAEALEHIPRDDTADRAAQRGSVLRNDGFAYTRAAVETDNPETAVANFDRANHRLYKALGETAMFVSGERLPNYKQEGPHATWKQQRRELFSEHAATLGLLARTATAEEVVLQGTDMTEQERAKYGHAHDFARLGTNGYFRVSNAMNGARNERIQGSSRIPHTAVWLARAAFGIVWSIKNDRGNLESAAKTFVRRLPDVSTPTAARQSVLTHP
jgi:hypothetical protein